MYCLEHAEADLYGADRIPCPLCGFGEAAADGEAGDLRLVRARGADDALRAVQEIEASGDAAPLDVRTW